MERWIQMHQGWQVLCVSVLAMMVGWASAVKPAWAQFDRAVELPSSVSGFGFGVAIHGDQAVVSSPFPSDIDNCDDGSLSVFERDPIQGWEESDVITIFGCYDWPFGDEVDLTDGYAIANLYDEVATPHNKFIIIPTRPGGQFFDSFESSDEYYTEYGFGVAIDGMYALGGTGDRFDIFRPFDPDRVPDYPEPEDLLPWVEVGSVPGGGADISGDYIVSVHAERLDDPPWFGPASTYFYYNDPVQEEWVRQATFPGGGTPVISGDYAVVGGRIYYNDPSDGWTHIDTVSVPNPPDDVPPEVNSYTGFGQAVALDGNYLVIGAPYEDVPNPYPAGDETCYPDRYPELNLCEDSGAVYVYHNDPNEGWMLLQRLVDPHPETYGYFGRDVDVTAAGPYVIVATNVDLDWGDVGERVYVFEREEPADTSPPVCGTLMLKPGPFAGHTAARVTVSDPESGITELAYQLRNADGFYEADGSTMGPFGDGEIVSLADAPEAVTLGAEKRDEARRSRIVVDVTNGAGLTTTCDPVLTTVEAETPETFSLAPNYPNPFNPTTTIRFTLPEAVPVRLAVYDVLGREVAVLVDEALEAGAFEVAFEAGGLPSGTYVYRVEAGSYRASGHMLLVK